MSATARAVPPVTRIGIAIGILAKSQEEITPDQLAPMTGLAPAAVRELLRTFPMLIHREAPGYELEITPERIRVRGRRGDRLGIERRRTS